MTMIVGGLAMLCSTVLVVCEAAKTNVMQGDSNQCDNQCVCVAGMNGSPGVPGVPGANGWPGDRGMKGDKGQQGNPGFPGEIGPPGRPGNEGRRGKRGFVGNMGNVGAPGNTGPRGDRGLPGPPGMKGDKGDGEGQRLAQVAFSVVRSQRLGPVSSNTLVSFDKILTNVGHSFNDMTSHFVSPINATFVVMTHIMGVDEREAHAFIMVNNKHQIPIHATSQFGSGSQSLVLQLQQGDHVWIELGAGSALMNDYTTFSGFALFLNDGGDVTRARARPNKSRDEKDLSDLKNNYLNDWHTW